MLSGSVSIFLFYFVLFLLIFIYLFIYLFFYFLTLDKAGSIVTNVTGGARGLRCLHCAFRLNIECLNIGSSLGSHFAQNEWGSEFTFYISFVRKQKKRMSVIWFSQLPIGNDVLLNGRLFPIINHASRTLGCSRIPALHR